MAKEKLNKIKVLKIMKKFKSELYHESSRIWFDKDQVHTHIMQVMNGNIDKQWQLMYLMTLEMYFRCWEI